MNVDLSNPTHEQLQFARDERTKAFIQFNLRIFWHTLFDPAPKTWEKLDASQNSIFEEFQLYVARTKTAIDWKIHLHFLKFLYERQILSKADRDLVTELLAAAAARWIGTALEDSDGIQISSCLLDNECILGLKEKGLALPRKVLLLPHEKITAEIFEITFIDEIIRSQK